MSMTLKGLFLFTLMVISLLLYVGCTETLKGDKFANQNPIVEFVNIPPDSQPFSRNPEVYWFGTDNDGLIDYYRYHVVRVDDVTGDPIVYATSLNDTMWTQIDVKQTEADPQTTQIIPLRADELNPVNAYVPQYIFVQAFDNLGAPSQIVYKILFRNDNPPGTRIYNIDGIVFVNSVLEGGIITGVKLRWEGSDRKDYEDLGLTAPPFDYEWKLYGPFSDSTLDTILTSSVKEVFVSEDARIFSLGDTMISCDTSITDTGVLELCDTLVFDSAYFDSAENTAFLTRDSILLVDDDVTHFNAGSLVTTSWNGENTWVKNIADTIYNVYRNLSLDTTAQMNFLFWVRSRDDAYVSDITPEFVSFPVIEPRYERDIAIIDFTGTTADFSRYLHVDTAKIFWYNLIHNWADNSIYNGNVIFDTAYFKAGETEPRNVGRTGVDYIKASRYSEGLPLSILLKHKMLILYNDYYRTPSVSTRVKMNNPEILSAKDAGLKVWLTMRNAVGGALADNPGFYSMPAAYTNYFGVEGMSFSSWFGIASSTGIRLEDFKGTYSMNETEWPTMTVDTARLHRMYLWGPDATFSGWRPAIGSLPEVSWAERSFGTEVMYLYKSLYGPNHPLGAVFRYDGAPCGHRFETNLFRSVHFTFTMLCMEPTAVQGVADNVFNWLYDPTLTATVSGNDLENRYPDAAVKISVEQAQENLRQRELEAGNQ